MKNNSQELCVKNERSLSEDESLGTRNSNGEEITLMVRPASGNQHTPDNIIK